MDDVHFIDSVHFLDAGSKKMAERVVRGLVASPEFKKLIEERRRQAGGSL